MPWTCTIPAKMRTATSTATAIPGAAGGVRGGVPQRGADHPVALAADGHLVRAARHRRVLLPARRGETDPLDRSLPEGLEPVVTAGGAGGSGAGGRPRGARAGPPRPPPPPAAISSRRPAAPGSSPTGRSPASTR